MWIWSLLSTDHDIKHFFTSFCKDTEFDIEYLINTNETVAKYYDIINNFPEFYKQAFVCYNLCEDDTQTKIPGFCLPILFYYNLFSPVKYLILKVRQPNLKIGLKAEFYTLRYPMYNWPKNDAW